MYNELAHPPRFFIVLRDEDVIFELRLRVWFANADRYHFVSFSHLLCEEIL